MLREVKSPREADFIIYDEAIYTPEEFADTLGLRFLVDEDEDDEPGEVENPFEPEDEDDEDEDPEEEDQPRKRRSKDECMELVADAVCRGYDTVVEIVDQTGLSYKTAKKYLEKIQGE